MTKIFAIPGSLRRNSASNRVLQAMVDSATSDIEIDVYDDLGKLPHFDDPQEVPSIVLEFIEKVKGADVVLICTPEYAFGIPGSLKNALDWTVASGDFMNKPVAVVTAASQGEKGHAALLLVLTAISARVIKEASTVISFVRAKIDPHGNINDPALHEELMRIVRQLSLAVPKRITDP